MNDMEMDPSRSSPRPELKVYKYRFLIVTIYGLYSGANLYQLNQFNVIEKVIEKHYHTSTFIVNVIQLLFMVELIIFIVPVVRIIEKYDLRVAGLLCSGITFLGAATKVLFTAPNTDNFNYILAIQFICGFAQVFTILLPAKIVATWFPAAEQNRACAAVLFGGQLGMLLGTVFPKLFVNEKTNGAEVQEGLFQMLLSDAFFCGFSFLAVIVFFKAEPPTPPSVQQCLVGDHKTHYHTAFWELSVNRDFLTLILLYGAACGMWSAFGLIEYKLYLHYFPKSSLDLNTIVPVTAISGGIIGNFLFGYILDKTLKYKLLTFSNFLLITLSYGTMALSFEMGWHSSSYVTMIIFGFFSSCSVNIGYQYIAEVTFPVSEVIPIALLQVIHCSVIVIYDIGFNVLLSDGYFLTVHLITIATFCLMTAGTYLLTSNLKRMLVKQEQRE